MRKIFLWGYRFSQGLVIFLCGVLLVLSSTAIGEYGDRYHRGSARMLVLLLALGLTVFFVWLWGKESDRENRMSRFLFLGILGMQVFFLLMVSCPSSFGDPSRVQNEALKMLKWNHGQMDENNIYLQNYPNNHFITILFYYFYKILAGMGITNLWVPTVILNVCCIDTGLFLAYAAAKKIKGVKAANMVLFFFLICPSTYLWLTNVYTNTISFPFIMGILYLGMDLERQDFRGIGKCLLLGLVSVTGYFVRPTTIIAIIALGLYQGVRFFQGRGEKLIQDDCEKRVKRNRMGKTLFKFGLLLFVCGLTWFSCNKIIRHHVDETKFTENFPIEHWIMMGMNEETEGGFNRNDRLFTASLSGYEGKKEGDRERLKQRLQHMGISGVTRQFVKKMTRVWAIGDDSGIDSSRYACHYPPLYQYVIGQYNTWFVFYNQAFRISMFFLIGIGLISQLLHRQVTPYYLYGLTFLGAICFFLIWEAGKRYNVCFNGVCIILMVDGGEEARKRLSQAASSVVNHIDSIAGEKRKRVYGIVKTGCCLGVICLIAGSLLLSTNYTKKSRIDKRMYFCSRMSVDAEAISWKGVSQPAFLEQTIQEGQMEWRNRWNRLKIFFMNTSPELENREYRVEVLSMDDNQVIYSGEIAPKDIKNQGAFVIRLKGKKSSLTGYKLRLTHLGKEYHLIPMVCKFPLLNPYPYGSLCVNGKKTDWDLSMSVYQIRKKS